MANDEAAARAACLPRHCEGRCVGSAEREGGAAVQRIAGLDVGDHTIGVAVSDPLGWTAQGITTLRRTEPAVDLQALADLLQRHEVARVVVGLPRNMNGTYGPRAELVRQFGESVMQQLGLPVTYWDERLTTVQAQRLLVGAGASRQRRKQVVDKIAAVFILQSFLDAQGHGGGARTSPAPD